MKNLNSSRASACSSAKPFRRSLLHAVLPLLLLATMLVTGCGANEPPVADTNAFVLSDTMLQRIRLDTVAMKQVENVIHLNGRIAADENQLASVYAIMSGQVISVDAELGDHVRKGQTLAKIRSGEVAKMERKLIEARSDREVAEKNFATKEELFSSQLLSERKLVEARYDLEKANAQLQRMNEVFSIYTIEAGSRYVLRSPIDGYVIGKSITRDITLPDDHPDPVFTIAELNEVWVLADVYESDIARVKEGMDAEVTTLSYPDKVFRGKVDRIFNILDPRTRTMRIRITLPNEGILLKPEMVAHVKLSFKKEEVLPAIPASSIISDNSRQYAMVFKDRYNVITREVKVAQTTGSTSWISEGLEPGEVIVSKNQLYLYDALNDR